MENELPIVVFDLNQPDNITKVATGEPVGTLISSGGRPHEHRDLTDADQKMTRAVDAMERDFQAGPHGPGSRRRSSSASSWTTTGTQTPLNQLAGISVPEPHQIVIQPWDRSVLGAIEKAITKSDIGLVPNVDGAVVRSTSRR
jgi:ribosome recycling factor